MLPGIWIDVNWWPRSWWHKLQTRHRFVQRIVAPSCQDHASYNLMEFADDAYAAYGYWMLLIWLLLILLRNEEQGFKRNGRVIAQIQAWDGRIKRGPIADVPCTAWWMTLDAWGLQGFAIATVQTIFYAYFLWIGVSHWRDAYEHLGTIISKNPLHLQVISKFENSSGPPGQSAQLHRLDGLLVGAPWSRTSNMLQSAAKKDQHFSKKQNLKQKRSKDIKKEIKKDPKWLTIIETWGNLWDRAQLHHPQLLECGTLPKAQELCYTFRHVLGNALAGVKFGEFEDETRKNTTTQLAGYRLVVSTAQGAFEGTMTMMPRRPTYK